MRQKQRDVLRLLMIGLTNLQIGIELSLSVGTIEKHVQSIRVTLKIKDIEGNSPRVTLVNRMWNAALEAG